MLAKTLLLISVALTCANGQLFDALYKKLARKGIKNAIPIKTLNEPVSVTLQLMIIAVNSLDTETGDLDLDVWLSHSWTDSRLAWNPADFSNITQIRLQHSDFWKPDIVPYRGHMQVYPELGVVAHDGSVMYIPRTRHRFRCDASNYTSEGTVSCNVKIGSWTYSGSMLNLTTDGDGVDKSEYEVTPSHWELLRHEGKINLSKYDCCEEVYPSLGLTLVFKDTRNKSGYFNIF